MSQADSHSSPNGSPERLLITQSAVVVPMLQISLPKQPALPEPTESPETAQIQPLYSDADLNRALLDFRQRRVVPPLAMQVPLVAFAHFVMNQLIDSEEYDEAQQIEGVIRALADAFRRAENEETLVAHVQGLENRLLEAKQMQATCEVTWEQRIGEFKERATHKMELLREKHEAERRNFEGQCQSPEFLQKFTKPSSQLLQLLKVQKNLALQHNFEGAKQVKERAKELQRQETDEAQKRAMRSVQQNYEKLCFRQRREIECAEANDIRKLKQMENEMKREKEAAEKLNKQAELRMKEQRMTLKRPVIPTNSRAASAEMARWTRKTRSGLAVALEVNLPDLKAVLGGRGK
jgi:hypothetical protein